MRVDRSKLMGHLRRIGCEGQVTEVVFRGAFGCAAITDDHLLLVIAPPLDGTEDIFPESGVGLSDLSKFAKALQAISNPSAEETWVEMEMEKHRLVIDERPRGVLRILTAAPKTIGTRVDEKTAEGVLAKAPTTGGIPLTRQLIEGIRTTFGLFKVTEVEVFLGPDGGKLRVGNDNSDVAEFESEDLKSDEPYSLLFGPHLVSVLSVVQDYANAVLRLGGPKQPSVIEDGTYKYVLSPKLKGVEAPKSKKAQKAEAQAAAVS